jgi:hypothetical protein
MALVLAASSPVFVPATVVESVWFCFSCCLYVMPHMTSLPLENQLVCELEGRVEGI